MKPDEAVFVAVVLTLAMIGGLAGAELLARLMSPVLAALMGT